jgi:hypothetical protein
MNPMSYDSRKSCWDGASARRTLTFLANDSYSKLKKALSICLSMLPSIGVIFFLSAVEQWTASNRMVDCNLAKEAATDIWDLGCLLNWTWTQMSCLALLLEVICFGSCLTYNNDIYMIQSMCQQILMTTTTLGLQCGAYLHYFLSAISRRIMHSKSSHVWISGD